ncbi:DNA-directed RNA polymerase I kDa polypeptide [Lyophyllum atratum]|nr:DNA-directed RNA polymerase I kDa polypeptide [Lyophyllum atratum]
MATPDVRAHKIGSLLFCPTCGTLLSLPQDGEDAVTCEQCGHVEPASSYENIEITTRSHPDAFPSALRQKRKTQTKLHEKGDQGTLVSEKCPGCGHLSAYSKEMQLRGADEGSTIFYTASPPYCVACKHGWRVNN